MRHGAHKAHKATPQYLQLAQSLFASSRGSHSPRNVRAVQLANGGAILGLDQALADKLNEVAPQSRRAIREAARAAERRSAFVTSASLAALVGAAASAIAVANPNVLDLADADPATTTTQLKPVVASESGSDTASASRSESRTPLSELSSASSANSADGASQQTANEGDWGLDSGTASLDVDSMSKSIADNAVVAALMDQDADALPEGFNPNHATGENGGNAYPWGQCTWYAYNRRVELGLPVGSYFGNGADWADAARTFGYWVDSTARHVGDVVVFQPGQLNADSYYGHVAVVEKIHKDGSIEVSESNVKGLGVISTRTISATDAAQLQFIHY
ncbi:MULTISPECIES: CHAP domain-containing protein [Bifidobacterium]|uniref:CHAP domain-containing protein n=1 Tax=Bifidobacterium TaxID=1678 RepID=UPI001BDD4C75|nr:MULTISPECIES: CHAP domain-containing protein [Bifidobacterium]MBT1160433.1 CHAP domain-containing protein [Bifidobacterium sp. SO1]MBW3079566.1 CHAP domain-containing protein [Bifidobacterium simiiventris]